MPDQHRLHKSEPGACTSRVVLANYEVFRERNTLHDILNSFERGKDKRMNRIILVKRKLRNI
jgi:hypothetical protein